MRRACWATISPWCSWHERFSAGRKFAVPPVMFPRASGYCIFQGQPQSQRFGPLALCPATRTGHREQGCGFLRPHHHANAAAVGGASAVWQSQAQSISRPDRARVAASRGVAQNAQTGQRLCRPPGRHPLKPASRIHPNGHEENEFVHYRRGIMRRIMSIP